jgi:hypothetical protein
MGRAREGVVIFEELRLGEGPEIVRSRAGVVGRKSLVGEAVRLVPNAPEGGVQPPVWEGTDPKFGLLGALVVLSRFPVF